MWLHVDFCFITRAVEHRIHETRCDVLLSGRRISPRLSGFWHHVTKKPECSSTKCRQKENKWSWIKPNFRFLMATIFPFLTGHAVFWRGTFKLLCDVMSEPRQSGADPSAWQRNIISHRVNALLYGSRNGTKFYMKSQLKSLLTFQRLETWKCM